MTAARDPAVLNLLLETSYLLKRDQSPRAQAAKRAWLDVQLGLEPERRTVTIDEALGLLKAAIELCEAIGIERVDVTASLMKRVDAGDRAAPDQAERLLDTITNALLDLIAARAPAVERESA